MRSALKRIHRFHPIILVLFQGKINDLTRQGRDLMVPSHSRRFGGFLFGGISANQAIFDRFIGRYQSETIPPGRAHCNQTLNLDEPSSLEWEVEALRNRSYLN